MSRLVCYNVQSAVDSNHHLIVAHEVKNKTDRCQLCRMGIHAQAALKEKKITVIADKGYYSGVDIKNSQDEGMMCSQNGGYIGEHIESEFSHNLTT